MTETTAPVSPPRLWTPAGFRDDEWTRAEDAGALEGNARVILPLAAFLSLDPARRSALRERIGVELAPGDKLEQVAEHLDEVALVALAFPAFSDGRSFSKAELLRSRHGYKGPLRATGQILVDQLAHMLRLGFDQFEVSNPVLIERLERGRTGGLGLYYQPTHQPRQEGMKYSWRRRAAG